ncbi:MAG: hypothetical protein ACREU8_09740, partial [Gammaproteobacteria bacterium]
FVLDEPSIGLHARDMGRVTKVLQKLRDAGNTLLVLRPRPSFRFAGFSAMARQGRQHGFQLPVAFGQFGRRGDRYKMTGRTTSIPAALGWVNSNTRLRTLMACSIIKGG